MKRIVRQPFPAVVDNSTLAAFRACFQKGFRTYIEHWKPKAESVHLVAGAAYARGLEVARRHFYEDGMSSADSIAQGLGALIKAYGDFQCPPDSAKSLERTAGALEFYFDRYPLETDDAKPLLLKSGKRAIEFAFAEPLPIAHPATGDSLIYSGRSDMVSDYSSGIYIEDDKTTSQLGPSWINSWELRSQFTGYVWAAKKVPELADVKGVLVRGVSILKTRYDTAQALTYRADWEVMRWYVETISLLNRMKAAWVEGYWNYNLDDACTSYGGCPFVRVCKTQDAEQWLPMYFEKRVWNPLTRQEENLDGTPIKPQESPVVLRTDGPITVDSVFV